MTPRTVTTTTGATVIVPGQLVELARAIGDRRGESTDAVLVRMIEAAVPTEPKPPVPVRIGSRTYRIAGDLWSWCAHVAALRGTTADAELRRMFVEAETEQDTPPSTSAAPTSPARRRAHRRRIARLMSSTSGRQVEL